MPNHKVALVSPDGVEFDFDHDVGVRWDFTTGGNSPQHNMVCTLEQDGALGRFPEGEWSILFREFSTTQSIKKVVPIRRVRTVGRDRFLWEFGDLRHYFNGLQVDVAFNSMREVNDVVRPSAFVDPNVAAFSQVPKAHFIPLTCRDNTGTRTRKGAAVNSASLGSKFFNKVDTSGIDFAGYEPWTALQALLWMLGTDGNGRSWSSVRSAAGVPVSISQWGVRVAPNVTENGVVIKRWNPRGSWAQAVDYLSRLAHVMVFVGPEGDFNVVSADPSEALNAVIGRYGQFSGEGGIPSVSKPVNMAPRMRRVFFPRYDEIPWIYDEVEAYNLSQATTDSPSPPAMRAFGGRARFFLENVLHNPQDVGDYKKGQDVEFLKLLDVWNNDAANHPNNTLAAQIYGDDVFTLRIIHRHIWTTALSHFISVDRSRVEWRNPILEARVSEIYRNFRRRWRIPEEWLDLIEDWRLNIGTIFSSTTRSRIPSPVFMDYSAQDSEINVPAQATFQDLRPEQSGHGFLRNVPIEMQNTYGFVLGRTKNTSPAGPFPSLAALRGSSKKKMGTRSLPTTADQYIGLLSDFGSTGQTLAASPARAGKIDGARGTFGIEFPVDLKGQTTEYEPWLVDPDTFGESYANMTILNENGKRMFGQLALAQDFRMIIPISIRWRTPNNLSRHYRVDTDGRKFLPYEPKGPVEDQFYPGFEAFSSYLRTQYFWRKTPEGMVVIDRFSTGQPIENFNVIQEIAEAESRVAYYRYLPRVVGTYRARGWNGGTSVGNAVGAILSYGGGLDSEYNVEGLVRDPPVWEFFSPMTKTVLGRLQEGTEGVIQ